jgi:serine/threonine protein kinase
MEVSVESICNQLARHKLLPPDQVRSLRQQWRDEAGAKAADVPSFCKWLQGRSGITTFQLDLMQRGHGDLLAVSDYRLVDRIGMGRMAGVYKGVHTSSGQLVAIKILPPSRTQNPQVLGRFLRETRLAAKLNHDNIVRTFQHGVTPENMHYIIMELLEGDPLDDVISKRKKLSVEEAVHLVCETAEGLDYLNELGIVHRDLKPANMMVVAAAQGAPNAGNGDSLLLRSVKILDIGLGKAVFDETGEDENLTQEGSILGTVNYMAPEQARNASAADIRADIYSLGCIMYELLTGAPPFVDTNIFRQIQRHASERPKPLTEFGVNEGVSTVVDRMLAKDPAMRYATPGQLLKDLQPYRKTKTPVKAAKPLASFLSWLETKPGAGIDPDGATLPPESFSMKPRAPEKSAAGAGGAANSEDVTLAPDANLLASMLPKPSIASSALPPSPKPAPAARTTPAPPAAVKPAAAPLAKPAAPVPTVKPAAPSNPSTPVPQPRNNAIPTRTESAQSLPEAGPVADPLDSLWQFGWTKRDWISASIGSGVTLFVVLLFYLLVRLVS